MKILKRLFLLLLLIPLWMGAVNLNKRLNIVKTAEIWQKERLSVVVTSPEVKPFLLGFDSVLADYIWINTMLYFGTHYNKDRDFEWLTSMIDATIMLNPSFFPAYEFAGLMVPTVTGDYEYARMTLEKGVGRVNRRNEWIMFYLSWIYYTEYKDYERAAELLSTAAHSPHAPPFWGQFAATLYTKAGQENNSLLFLYALRASTDNPQVKEALKDKLLELLGEQLEGVISEEKKRAIQKQITQLENEEQSH